MKALVEHGPLSAAGFHLASGFSAVRLGKMGHKITTVLEQAGA